MSGSAAAIIGSGIAATTIAYLLTKKGHQVILFEKGPEYPYPHSAQYSERTFYRYHNPTYNLPPDLQGLTVTGDYQQDINKERRMVVGGCASEWTAIAPRMNPYDFKIRSLYGYGEDWPITYDDLEPYYCKAEALLGVSGTDADNPFAPPRSQPYPLPPFELSYDDIMLADRLRKNGIVLHTTPQARTRAPYDGRPSCVNFGTCKVCPIGARYSPSHHLQRALATGLCQVYSNVSVRRIILDKSGQAKGVVYQPNAETKEREHPAKVVIVAAGAIESARLLFLSRDNQHPDGVGNRGGHVGRHLTFHHLWHGSIQYKDIFSPGMIGAETGQSHQFRDPPGRGRLGGIKVEFSSSKTESVRNLNPSITGPEIVETLKRMRHRRVIALHSESAPSSGKYVTLSDRRDRFHDPYAHVHYQSAEFDYETYRYARNIFERFAAASGGQVMGIPSFNQFDSGYHHMGTCRMGNSERDSVVNEFGKIHGSPNAFVAGASTFVGCSGAVNPTLTIVALAMRTADYIADQLV